MIAQGLTVEGRGVKVVQSTGHNQFVLLSTSIN